MNSTSFGPEESEFVALQHNQKQKDMKQSQYMHLTGQIEVSTTKVANPPLHVRLIDMCVFLQANKAKFNLDKRNKLDIENSEFNEN